MAGLLGCSGIVVDPAAERPDAGSLTVHAGLSDAAAPGDTEPSEMSDLCSKCSGDIYDDSIITDFELSMAQTDWQKIVDDPKGAGDRWQMAALTWKKGSVVETVGQVAVKARGHASRIPGNVKPSVRLSFDEFVPGRRWKGVEEIKLDSMIGNTDATFMRDRLAYGVYRQMGLPAPRSAHARLFVNGDLKGLYEVEEPITKSFLEHRFGTSSGNLYEMSIYKPLPDGTTAQVASNFDHYRWMGSDQSAYLPFPFQPKTNAGEPDHGEVVSLVDVLNNAAAAERRTRLATVMNVEAFITYLAVMTTISDWDGVTSSGGRAPNNHFWYRSPDTGRLEPIVWDPNVSFDGFTKDGGTFTATLGLWHRFDRTQATAWIKDDAVASALYLDTIWKVMDGPLAAAPDAMDRIYQQIRAAVYEDPKKAIADPKLAVTNERFEAEVKRIRENWIPRRRAFLESVLPPRKGSPL
jgi:hypothetical protein